MSHGTPKDRDDAGPQRDNQRDLRRFLVRGLRRILAARGLGEDLCEDFAQETLLRIHDRQSVFRGESRFTTWALSIATRVAFDELRHKRWKDVSFETATAGALVPLAFEPGADAPQEKGLYKLSHDARSISAVRCAIIIGMNRARRPPGRRA